MTSHRQLGVAVLLGITLTLLALSLSALSVAAVAPLVSPPGKVDYRPETPVDHNEAMASTGSDTRHLAGALVDRNYWATSTMTTAYLPISLNLPPPTPAPLPEPAWLRYLNDFRSQASLAPLAEDGDWSNGDWFHSRYMVKNDYVGHSEDPGNPWYTPEGQQAAQNGNVFVTSWVNAFDESAIDFWMRAPFHAVAVIDPQLHSTGFGSYREALGLWKFGATLDVGRGLGQLPPGTRFPLPYPSDRGQTWLLSYTGGEWPDPLTSCLGYSTPTGPPVILQLGDGSLSPNVTGYSFTSGGVLLESCLFDETSYSNPDGGAQSTGRIILNNRDAVILLPRKPLVTGQTYSASVSANGLTTTWSFSAAIPPGQFGPPSGEAFWIE